MSSTQLETDYLVVGAGAASMAVTDALLAHTDASVTIVDRRHAPGGHWIDAYPFVRLHQPSAFYGVSSVPLGADAVDRCGFNSGYYPLANADELRAYYGHVMDQHFLPTGRVRYFPATEYEGEEEGGHRFSSRICASRHIVRVRRKLVDTSYVEGQIPATSAPPFEVAEGVRCVPAGAVARLDAPPARYVVVGAGKTALDTCVWLLSNGVEADAIQWIKPREAWWLNRRWHQPHAQLPAFHAGVAMQMEAFAQATSIDDVFSRLESQGLFQRVDPAMPATMCTGAIVSEAELALLRQIRNVVRMGRVRRIEPDRIVLEQGEVPTSPDTLHVHCAARGLARPPLRPIFEGGRITVQPMFWGFASFQFALLGMAEALLEDDAQKNRLCRPITYWDRPADYLAGYLAVLASERARAAYPELAAWARQTRLNPMAGLAAHREDPVVIDARERIRSHAERAAANLVTLLRRPAAPPAGG